MNFLLTFLRRVVRRNFGRVRRAILRVAVALRQWLSPDENPFFTRALRTESRRYQPWLSVLIPTVLTAIVAGGSWMMWLRQVDLQNESGLKNGALPVSPLQISAALGSNPIGALAIITALVTAMWTIFAVRSRASSLLREEALRGTLDGLQMLPLREELWLWMMSLQPLLIALLVWCVGLPVYMFAVWMGAWSVWDIVGLLLVWLWIGHVAPLWQPVMWKQKGKTPARVDANTLRAALLLQNQANARGISLSQSLELQRRAQRLLMNTEAASAMTTANNAVEDRVLDAGPNKGPNANQNGTQSAKQTVAKKQVLDAKVTGAVSTRRDARGGWNWGGAFFAFFVVRIVLSWGGVFAGGVLASFHNDLIERVPPEVPPMLPWFIVTWPVVLAKIMLSPLWFFAFSLPPIFVLLPLWIGFSRARNVQLASLVSASETFWTERRARTKATISRAMQVCAGLGALGYMWHTLIINGELAPALWRRAYAFADSGASLAALWTFFVIGGALMAWRAAETAFARAAHQEVALLELSQNRASATNQAEDRVLAVAPMAVAQNATPIQFDNALQKDEVARNETLDVVAKRAQIVRASWRDAATQAARVVAWTFGVYFVCCWLGATSGWSAAWQARLLPTVFAGGAFLFVCWSASVINSALPFESRALWSWARALWFFGLPLEIALRVLFALVTNRPAFAFEQAPHVLLSPFVMLFALLRPQLDLGELWFFGVLAQVVLGAACFLAAQRIVAVRRVESAEERVREGSGRDRVLDVLLWPLRLVGRGFSALGRGWSRASAWFNNTSENVNARVIARGAALDNAVLTGELRRRVRKINWCRHWVVFAVLATAVFGFLGVWPLVADLRWRSNFGTWIWAISAYNWSDWSTTLVAVTLGVLAVLCVLAVSDLGQSFDADRANGTLVFLFLTPMQDREILRGKLLASLFYIRPLLCIGVPFLLMGTVVSALAGSWKTVFIVLGGVAVVMSLLALSCGLQLLFGVRSPRPGTGSGKAILAGLIFEIALWTFNSWLQSALYPFSRNHATAMWIAFLVVLCALHLWMALLCWHLALRSLRTLRLGKIGTRGKAAA